MQVQITRDHIKQGKRFSDTESPVALAIQEATGRPIRMHGWDVAIVNRRRVRLPDAVRVLGLMFDLRTRVRPLTFDLDI